MDAEKRIPIGDVVAPHQVRPSVQVPGAVAGSRLVAQTEPGWYERLPRDGRSVPAYRDRDDMPGPSRARLAGLIRQVRAMAVVGAIGQIATVVALLVHAYGPH